MSYVTQQATNKPIGMTAAIAINGSIIAAIMLSPVVMPPRTKTPPITAVNVQPYKEPPPEVIEPKAQDPIIAPTFVPKPIVDNRTPADNQISMTNQQPTGPLPTSGTLGPEPKIAMVEPKTIIPEVIPPTPIFKAAVRDPRFAGSFQPNYPTGLLQREVEGRVTIKVLIGTDGRVRQATIVSASHPDFAAATEKQALKQWRFQPATRDGKPVEDWQTLTVRFDINN
jgi:periplasmic protein TonB